jgi:hypothetical protein
MCKLLSLNVLLVLTLLSPAMGEGRKLGKLFIKTAPVAEGQFADPTLEDTVKDMKKRSGDFVIVTDESEADFLIVVLERKVVLKSPLGTVVNDKTVVATLSVRDGSAWKPAIKLEHGGGTGWGVAAGRVIGDAEKWVKANAAK